MPKRTRKRFLEGQKVERAVYLKVDKKDWIDLKGDLEKEELTLTDFYTGLTYAIADDPDLLDELMDRAEETLPEE